MPLRAIPNRIHGYAQRGPLRHHGGMRLLASTPRRCTAALVLILALSLSACGKSTAHWNDAGGGNTNDGGKVAAAISDPKDAATDVPASAEITYQTRNAKNATVEVTNAGTGAKV